MDSPATSAAGGLRHAAPAAVGLLGALLIWLLGIDEPLFYGINALHELGTDRFWASVTILGDALITIPLTLLLLRNMPRVFAPMFVVTLLATVALHSLKTLFELPRPGGVISPVDFHFVEKLYRGNSFPSGHATTIFAWISVIYLQLSEPMRRSWGGVLIGFAALVALSRCIVGAHWPADVFAGAALGWLSGMASTLIAGRWHWLRSETGHRFVVGFFLVVAIVSLFFANTDYSIVKDWHTGLITFTILFAYFPTIERYIHLAAQAGPVGLLHGCLSGAGRRIRQLLDRLGRPRQENPGRLPIFNRATAPAVRWRWLAHILIFVAALLLVEWLIGWQQVLMPWRALDASTVWLPVLLLVASYLCRTMRLVQFFDEVPLGRTLACFRLVLIHNFYNNLLPMRTGEISFPLLMSGEFGVPYQKSTVTLVWMRLLDLVAIALIALCVLLVFMRIELLTLVVIGCALVLPLWISRVLGHIVGWLRRSRPQWEAQLTLVEQGWPRGNRDIWLFWAWTLLNWIVKIAAFLIVFLWFIEVPIWHSLVAIIGAELTSVLPIHSIAGTGSYESGAVLGLALFGESVGDALAAAINLHLFIIGMTLVSGLAALLVPRFRQDPVTNNGR